MRILSLILIALSTFCLQAFGAAADDPPAGYTAEQKAEWVQADCKWRIAKRPELAGYSQSAASAKECFALGRYIFIAIDNDPTIAAILKKPFLDDLLIIYDNHRDQKELCHLIPVKRPYDNITAEDVQRAYAQGPQSFDALIKRLDRNISLQCLTM